MLLELLYVPTNTAVCVRNRITKRTETNTNSEGSYAMLLIQRERSGKIDTKIPSVQYSTVLNVTLPYGAEFHVISRQH